MHCSDIVVLEQMCAVQKYIYVIDCDTDKQLISLARQEMIDSSID